MDALILSLIRIYQSDSTPENAVRLANALVRGCAATDELGEIARLLLIAGSDDHAINGSTYLATYNLLRLLYGNNVASDYGNSLDNSEGRIFWDDIQSMDAFIFRNRLHCPHVESSCTNNEALCQVSGCECPGCIDPRICDCWVCNHSTAGHLHALAWDNNPSMSLRAIATAVGGTWGICYHHHELMENESNWSSYDGIMWKE